MIINNFLSFINLNNDIHLCWDRVWNVRSQQLLVYLITLQLRVHLIHFYYSASKVKDDVIFKPDQTVSYRAPRTMIFNQHLSTGSESDVFTTVNVPLYVS